MDPFAPLEPYTPSSTYSTLCGDARLDTEMGWETTQSCAETGCGGGPLPDFA